MLIFDILFYSFIVVIIVQAFYYLGIFQKFSFSKAPKGSPKSFPVSVIICAKNEAQNLREFLPSILQQDYPNFEVVLINDSSNDDTLEVMETFKTTYDFIKIVDVKNVEAFWGNKKYALTLGIKAAKNKHLLFTDADCKPVSNQWITEMCSQFSDSKTIVIGYGGYQKIKGSLLNKLIRYETLLTATQYLSYAKIGIPYMAVGRNLAYKSDTFYEARGFMSHIDLNSGDDDLFVNEIATSDNTAVCTSPDSFTLSKPKTTFSSWILQKRRHVSTAQRYKTEHKIALGLFYVSQFLFWLLAILLLSFQHEWIVVTCLVGLRFVITSTILGLSAKKLNETDLIVLFPFLELFLIVAQFFIFIKNLIAKPHHWK
ncbi:glycosyltransferase [Mangrovimonas sp. TPBH4]|uniref:glycosyltransferase n=1 Tax=Mangrovimonas sp. TPBH4 TaxID=1645914 RepID=UPI0006B51C27|nr:glycosyltransferase [Mangrovimonas sp. TPBH4]